MWQQVDKEFGARGQATLGKFGRGAQSTPRCNPRGRT
jgi:hypothetical protein